MRNFVSSVARHWLENFVDPARNAIPRGRQLRSIAKTLNVGPKW